MIADTNTIASTTAYRHATFSIPRTLVKNTNTLRDLSGSALKLYIFLSWRYFRKTIPNLHLLDWEITSHIGIPTPYVPEARQELADAGLITFSTEKWGSGGGLNRAVYSLVQEPHPVRPIADIDIAPKSDTGA
jgi:hypothetical protein